ncbi:hypothetical protein D3C86_2136140 [compost metagenome]
MHFDNSVTERIPIPNNILSVKEKVSEIVNQINNFRTNNLNHDVADLERQIDQIIFQLYNLSDEEIAIIENT